MNSFSASPRGIVSGPWRHRDLVIQFARRDVVGRYRGSYAGMIWSFATPLVMLVVYTLFFGVLMQARWGGGSESTTDFAVTLFAGLIVFNLFADNISRASTLILNNVNYVKKVIFPLDILSWAILLSALFHMLISLLILLAANLLLTGAVHWTLLLLPLILAPFCLFLLGVNWLLSSVGTYIRDIGQIVSLIQSASLFLSPVFYPLSSLGEEARFWIGLNPLTYVIENFRRVALWGELPEWNGLLLYWLFGLVTAAIGFAWFQKTRKGFADVL